MARKNGIGKKLKKAVEKAAGVLQITAQETKKEKIDLAKLKDISEIKNTAEVPVPEKLIDQVIGQENAVEIIKKAAKQRRNILLVGTPGTGKSMIAQAMAELLPAAEMEDTLIIANYDDENNPKVKTVKAGEGRKIIMQERSRNRMAGNNTNIMLMGFTLLSTIIILFFMRKYFESVIVAAMLIGSFVMMAAIIFAMQLGRGRLVEPEGAKLIVDNSEMKKAPFLDGTGSRAGALLGDCRHDPFQSFEGDTEVYCGNKKITLEALWNETERLHPERIEKRENGHYCAIALPKNRKYFTKGMKSGKIVKSRIYSINMRKYEGRIVEIEAGTKKLKTTPEHEYILEKQGKEAKRILKNEKVLGIAK